MSVRTGLGSAVSGWRMGDVHHHRGYSSRLSTIVNELDLYLLMVYTERDPVDTDQRVFDDVAAAR
jgi:hypothetical protein